MAVHLRRVSRKPGTADTTFPFSVPTIASLGEFDVAAQVNFFVGENGSGKSPLLEGLAAGAVPPAVGAAAPVSDQTVPPQHRRRPATPLVSTQPTARRVLLDDMVAHESQFIIATQSPMRLAFPGARIYSFDTAPVRAVAYAALDHVALTRDFLNLPEQYLRRLHREGERH